MPYYRRRISDCAGLEIRDEWAPIDIYGIVARLISPYLLLGDTKDDPVRDRIFKTLGLQTSTAETGQLGP